MYANCYLIADICKFESIGRTGVAQRGNDCPPIAFEVGGWVNVWMKILASNTLFLICCRWCDSVLSHCSLQYIFYLINAIDRCRSMDIPVSAAHVLLHTHHNGKSVTSTRNKIKTNSIFIQLSNTLSAHKHLFLWFIQLLFCKTKRFFLFSRFKVLYLLHVSLFVVSGRHPPNFHFQRIYIVDFPVEYSIMYMYPNHFELQILSCRLHNTRCHYPEIERKRGRKGEREIIMLSTTACNAVHIVYKYKYNDSTKNNFV